MTLPVNRATLALLVLLPLLAWAAGAKKGKPDKLSVRGYVHVQWKFDFRAGAFPNHGFDIRRGRVKFRYKPVDRVLGAVEFGCDELNLTVKDVYVEYRAGRSLRFIAGRHKMPFSREELCPASRLLLVERGETNDAFEEYGHLGRDVGVMVEGDLLERAFPIGYAVGVFNGTGGAFSDYDNAKQFVERLTFAPVRGLSVGLNSTQHTDSATGRPMFAHGVDFACGIARATLQGEILLGNRLPDATMLGWQLVGSYRLGAFEPGVRYEQLHQDLKEPGDCMRMLTCNLSWEMHRKVRLLAGLLTDLGPERMGCRTVIVQVQVRS